MMATWQTFSSEQKQATEAIFIALTVADQLLNPEPAAGLPRRFGFSELRQWTEQTEAPMSPEMDKALKADNQLQQTLQRLLVKNTLYHFPRAAAASSGNVENRSGNGFQIQLRQSRVEPDQYYVLIHLTAPQPPKLLFLLNPGLPNQKYPLPRSREGTLQLLAHADSPLVKTLRDVHTEVFLN